MVGEDADGAEGLVARGEEGDGRARTGKAEVREERRAPDYKGR